MGKQKSDNIINIFDLAVILITTVAVILTVHSLYFYEPVVSSNRVVIVVSVPIENIGGLVEKEKLVFFNGVDQAVNVKSVVKEGSTYLVSLSAPGKISGDKLIFNGQNILINQKAEIRGTYFAQGRITSIADENN